MRVDFAFGKTGLIVDLPSGFRYRVLQPRSAQPLAEPVAAVEAALDAPTGAAPLPQLARGRQSAAISICDITRPAPNRLVLPPVLRRLEQAGIPRERITILIATGLHRPATAAEIREICGDAIAGSYRVVNHDARTLAEHRHLGATQSGTSVYIDERFVSADLHITLGFIEPHLMLGYSGGRKLIAPGLAAQETIKVLHSPKFMRDARAAEGSIEDNPLHRELLEIARMARHDFMVDVALGRGMPGDRPICGVFAGEPVSAHRRGVEFVSQVMLETIEKPVDAVITTCAGHPLDLTFYQAIKGITAAAHIVKPGGKILLLAACEEGTGAAEFSHMLKESPSGEEFLTRIANAPVTIDQWQLEKLALVARNADVLYYVPGLPREYHAALWGRAFATAAGAVEAMTAPLNPGAEIAVIPEGPYVLAKVEQGCQEVGVS
ncbi:MAG: nickel-dependent lactate racemase [Acidobacteriia bacterium]|nr:nickel-dependent lactate racemase [Terriglobia bacterium]